MMEPLHNTKIRAAIIIAVFLPVFVVVNLWFEKKYDSYLMDFAAYWQAGHMTLFGQNIYNNQEWVAERSLLGTAPYSETFQYPLAFAMLLAPLSLLTLDQAFMLWRFIGEFAILTSLLILFTFFPKRSMFFELLAIITAFLFPPTFLVLRGGQLAPVLLLFIALSIYFFSREKWLYGGLIVSLMLLKPSLGVPFLALTSIWLFSKKQWLALAGIAFGALLLYGVGALYNSHWVLEYLSIGKYTFDKYNGWQITLWSLAGVFFKSTAWQIAAGIVGVCVVLLIAGTFLIGKNNIESNPFRVAVIFLPVTLLIAPYAWNYEQALLVIPVVYILMTLSSVYGDAKSALFSLSVISLSFIMILVSNSHGWGNDAWCILVTVFVWFFHLAQPRLRAGIDA